jgi:hypothetical protein
VNYKEFLEYIKKNELSIKKIDEELGYSHKSILNNWRKNDSIPKKALLAINLYIKMRNKELEINELLKKYSDSNIIRLSDNALRIAKHKSNVNGIAIEEYVASLIVANA